MFFSPSQTERDEVDNNRVVEDEDNEDVVVEGGDARTTDVNNKQMMISF